MRLNVRRYIVLGMVGLAACGSSVAPKGPETSRAAPAAAPATAAPTASGSATASAPTSAAATPSGDGSKFCQLSKQQFDRIPELMAKIPNATANDAKKLLDEVAAESATIVASAPSSLKADIAITVQASQLARAMLLNKNDPTVTDKFTKLVADPEFVAASGRVASYYKTNCGFDPASLAGG